MVIAVDILAIVATSAMLAMTFPGVSYPTLAWIALVPLFLSMYRSGYQKAIIFGVSRRIYFFCLSDGVDPPVGRTGLVPFLRPGVLPGRLFRFVRRPGKVFSQQVPCMGRADIPLDLGFHRIPEIQHRVLFLYGRDSRVLSIRGPAGSRDCLLYRCVRCLVRDRRRQCSFGNHHLAFH